MKAKNFFMQLACAAVACVLGGCEPNSFQGRNIHMTMPTLRLQTEFASTKTVCFGRFAVDVPLSAEVVWGDSSVDLGINIYPQAASQVMEEAEKFKNALLNTKAINHDNVPLFLAEENMSEPPGKVLIGYEGFDAVRGLEINGYFTLGNDGLIIDSRPLSENRERAMAKVRSIARRLRLRSELEVPAEPGNCLENAFLADEPAVGDRLPIEHIRIGFRLKEFPDTHISVFIGPPDSHRSEKNTLEWQLGRLERDQTAEDPNHPLLKTVYFRRGPRQIHDWLNGYEALSRSPEQADMRSIHDFVMDFKGVVGDSYKPYADIRMQTGVADNLAGAVKPSLTDEEAVAVWDAITSTIRVRPTTTKASAQQAPRKPLGERLVSGRTCSQTGWWQAAEPEAAHTLPRRRIEAGATMPMAVVPGKPTLWDKLKGEQPRHQVAAVWQLVAYED
ncbi:T6SS immunity protein Tli4 family protein [Massilia sp. YMA4]|uniref:T6SS immunity protein Tli4 family protein n=1 Tax=Massilia sp. YMA4 TaxID=1593482 RepID=UPI001582A558|nr:T6SS immunity protein Tli4 family protein [Massilia sp. YMA4]